MKAYATPDYYYISVRIVNTWRLFDCDQRRHALKLCKRQGAMQITANRRQCAFVYELHNVVQLNSQTVLGTIYTHFPFPTP